jgi:hypothetical protein
MTERGARPVTKRIGKLPPALSRRQQRLTSLLRREIDDIYRQIDTQLTRLAEIQLQFAELRSKLRDL